MRIKTIVIASVAAIGVTIAAADDWHYVKVGAYGGTPLSLQKGPDEIPQLLYQDGSSGLTYARYVNGVWQKERVNAAVPAKTYSFLIDRQNRPHIYWCSGTKVYHAKKEGANWVTKDIYTHSVQPSGEYFGACLRPNGNAYVTISKTDWPRCFWLLEFDPNDVKILEKEGPEGYNAYVAADAKGVGHVTYEYYYSRIYCVKYITWENGTWSAPTIISNAHEEDHPENLGIASGPNDTISAGISGYGQYPLAPYSKVTKKVGGSWRSYWAGVELYDFKTDVGNRVHYWYHKYPTYPDVQSDAYFHNYYEADGAEYFHYEANYSLDDRAAVLPQFDGNPTFVRKGFEQTDNNLYYWYYGTFTGVEDFAARSEAAGVALSWRPTTSYAGFNLYRAEGRGESRKVNSSLIAGRAPFRYVDADVARGVTYAYELEAVKATGRSERFGPLEVTFEGSAAKAAFTLGQCRPNPATATATIPFTLASASPVELAIYDVAGRRVYGESGSYDAGPQELKADVTGLAPGVYVYRMTAAGVESARRMVVTK